MNTVATETAAAPICETCNRPKWKRTGFAASYWRCNFCARNKRLGISDDTPPVCKKCCKPKIKLTYKMRDTPCVRWVCTGCQIAARTANREALAEAKVAIPERPKPVEPKQTKPRSPIEAAIREYWACERRQREPVADPSRAIRTRLAHGHNPFPKHLVGGKK